MIICTRDFLGFDLDFDEPTDMGFYFAAVEAINDTSQFKIALGGQSPVVTMTRGDAKMEDHQRVIEFLKKIGTSTRFFYDGRLKKEEFVSVVVNAARGVRE